MAHNNALEYTPEVEAATAPLYPRVSKFYGEAQWRALAPYIHAVNTLKKEKNAVILAHNYMTPDIYHCVGDIVGDSLKLAQVAAETKAQVIIQAGVHFMAETSKILCPEKRVFIPDMKAGCSLSEGITGADVRALKAKNPNVPVVTYVNTSADVKAESDVCCTSSNAVKIVRALRNQGHKQVYCIPDQYLAQNVAAQVEGVEVLTYDGSCMVHEQFSAADVARMRQQSPNAVILAHPECPPDVVEASDFAGSTAQLNDYIVEKQPKQAILITECSMSDNIAAMNPNVELIKGCQLCPHMKRITLPKIYHTLLALDGNGALENEIFVDEAVAALARVAIQRMLELS